MNESLDIIEKIKKQQTIISDTGRFCKKIDMDTELPIVEKELQRIPELEAKAKAFDVLKGKIDIDHYKGNKLLVVKSMRDYMRLSQEEYDALKQAGVD